MAKGGYQSILQNLIRFFERWQKVLVEAGELLILSLLAGVPKNHRRLINNRTKVFCLILRISFILHKTYFTLDFEINIVEIR